MWRRSRPLAPRLALLRGSPGVVQRSALRKEQKGGSDPRVEILFLLPEGELLVDLVQLVLHRARSEAQPLGNGSVREALRDEGQHLLLAGSQLRQAPT